MLPWYVYTCTCVLCTMYCCSCCIELALANIVYGLVDAPVITVSVQDRPSLEHDLLTQKHNG